MFKNPINMAFEKLTQGLNEPSWLHQIRQDALKKFQELGMPSRKSELWKYTNIKRLEKLPEVTDIAEGNEHFVFTIKSDLAEGTDMKSITAIDESQWVPIKTDKERVFVELNTAMFNGGFSLDIPANSELKLHIQYQQISENWENIRTQINVGENAHLDLTESYDYDCRINHVSVINADKNARIKLQSHKLLAKTAALIHYNKITCAQNVHVKKCTTNNNANLSHTIEDMDFNGEHCDFQSSSINVTHSNCHISENIQTNHLAGNCKSEVIKRSLATDKSEVAINAKAVVSVAADGSDIAQSLKNTLLSDDAKINSRPELEINTDDVIAAHGSTTGKLDDAALTYLRSRGITKDQAEIMLIESFLQDANIFKVEDFLDRIEL